MGATLQTRGVRTRFPMLLLLAALSCFLLSLDAAQAQTVEIDSDRLGSDYDRVTLGAENYRLCQAICEGDNMCVAWTYTPSGFGEYETPQC